MNSFPLPVDLPMYLALAEFALSFLAFALRRRRLGWAQYTVAFSMALTATVLRGFSLGHAPLRNLYDVFLVLAVLLFPMSLLERFLLRVRAEAFDALLAALLLVPPAFVFSPEIQPLPAVLRSPLFIPHVLAYLLGYAVLLKAAVLSAAGGFRRRGARRNSDDPSLQRLMKMGFPFLTVGLLTGALWGKQAWGDWWNWDPKELWSLATWLVYVLYFHVRSRPLRRPETADAAFAAAGGLFILLTLLWVNLSRFFPGLHAYAT